MSGLIKTCSLQMFLMCYITLQIKAETNKSVSIDYPLSLHFWFSKTLMFFEGVIIPNASLEQISNALPLSCIQVVLYLNGPTLSHSYKLCGYLVTLHSNCMLKQSIINHSSK